MKSFSELTRKEKVIELLRWICVLPATVLGSFVGKVAGGLLGMLAETVGLVNPPSEMGFNTYMRYLIWFFPEGVAVVVAGAKTAPRWRLATASVVAVLWILRTDRIHGWGYATVVATAVSAGCGAAFIFCSEKLKRRPE